MQVSFYMDVHVPRAITAQLRLRGVKVITAQEDNAARLLDDELLERALALGCVLVTFDDDLLAEARKRQKAFIPFAGVVYMHLLRVSIGTCINNLELIAKVIGPQELFNEVTFLPL